LDELVTEALILFQKQYGPYRRSSFHSTQHMLRNVVSYVTWVCQPERNQLQTNPVECSSGSRTKIIL